MKASRGDRQLKPHETQRGAMQTSSMTATYGKSRLTTTLVLAYSFNHMTSMTGEWIIQGDANFRRLSYNDPTLIESPLLVQAIGNATDPFEANALAYKVIVASELKKNGIFTPPQENGGNLVFGTRIPFENDSICVDIVEEFADGTALPVRCLARGERLYMEELVFWESLAQSPSIRRIIFAHEAEIHPLEERFILRLKELYQKVELVHIPIPVPGQKP